MIELKGVNRAFKNGNETTQVLKDINLNIQAGEFIAVMGPSGSGKSTLINILGFIDRGYSGIYNFEHESYKQSSDSKLAEIRNRIFENVSIPLIYNGMPAKKRSVRVKQRLADVGLTGKENLLPSKLSGGQQQRVAIARAIVNEPRFIIADEPTGALDSETSKEIMALFGSLNKAQQTTLIMVTHDRKVAEQADRIIHILDGRIQSEEVMTHEQFI